MNKGVGQITGDDFRRMQLLQLEMLAEMDRICRKNNIKYSIISGTLLGAVRHKGFIPWDDDIDVAMLRVEYEKFKKVAIDELDESICFFQDHDTDPEYPWGYGKLRRTNTTYIRPRQEKMKFKTGVYIDIMPLDDIPNNGMGQVINDFYCFVLRKILYSPIGKDDPQNNVFIRTIYAVLSKIRVDSVYKKINSMAKRSNNTSNNPVRVLLLPSGGKEIKSYTGESNKGSLKYGMPKEWFLNTQDYAFEEHVFLGIRDYDDYLRSRFGNYMELPPENKRVAKAPAASWEF